MRNRVKKICSVLAAATVLSTAFSFASCKDTYKGTKLEYTPVAATEKAVKNGGFAVEYGEYVYFVNGVEEHTAKNKYGDVVKGALMRIKSTDLSAGDYTHVETVVPMLFVAKDYTSGIYIYNNRVYYATPTTTKSVNGGEVESGYIDFKSANLDGSEAMKDYYFRLSDNASKYRFVEEGETVYCLYEKDGDLYSYNTVKKTHTMLVKDATEYYYDTDDLSNPNVYYTMPVTKDLDAENQQTETYNQIYVVNAAATATVDKEADGKVGYTVTGGKSYKFDKKGLEKNQEGVDVSKYSTYPYVNLGELVLDGVGFLSDVTQYNDANNEAQANEPDGYTYDGRYYKNGGIYFTRSGNDELFYLPAERGEWNTVSGNNEVDTVAINATVNATEDALFTIENETHVYFYLDGTTLSKATANEDGTATVIPMAYELATDVTLWTLDGDYLYYFGAGTRDRSLNRINYKGEKDHYLNLDPMRGGDEYKTMKISYVDINDDWYKPEIFGETLLYANAQYFGQGGNAYNYIYGTKLGETETLKKAVDEYEEILEEIETYENTDVKNAMNYYFGTGTSEKFDKAVEKEEDIYDANQIKEFGEFKALFAEGGKYENAFANKYTKLLGVEKKADVEAIDADWELCILQGNVQEAKEEGMDGWVLALIISGGAIVVIAIAAAIIINRKKKAALKKEQEATINAYKRKKIDTTDDKTIDVYAEEPKAEETAEETSEETVEVVEEATEEVVEETTEEKTEETNE